MEQQQETNNELPDFIRLLTSDQIDLIETAMWINYPSEWKMETFLKV